MQRLFASLFKGTPSSSSNTITDSGSNNSLLSVCNPDNDDNIHDTLHRLLLSTLSSLNGHNANTSHPTGRYNSISTGITEENNALANSLQAQSVFNNLSMRMHSLSALSTLIASQKIKQLSSTVDGHSKSIEELREENNQLNKVVHSLTNALGRALARIEGLIDQAKRSDNLLVNGGLLIGSIILHKLLFLHEIIGLLLSASIQLMSTFTNKRLRSGKRIQALLDIVTILGIYNLTKKHLMGIKY